MRHRIGDTIALSREIKFGGESRLLFGWKASSRIRGKGVDHLFDCTLVFDEDGGTTFVEVRASPEQQKNWQPCIAQMDLRLESPEGYVIHAPKTPVDIVRPITTGTENHD